MKPVVLSSAILAVFLVLLAPAAGQEGVTPAETNMANLQTAVDGEFTARARYRAFAKVAAEEGYGEVASLFRACARAEEIHAGRFMSLLRARGGEGMATTAGFEVGTTKENLQTAYLWEKKERDQLYPSFAAAARAAGDDRAAEVFEFVRDAETEHGNLCQDALNHLEERTAASAQYWVCKGCGYTTAVHTGGACPFCGGAASDIAEIE